MNKKIDWFHEILEYLYKQPLDGTPYDIRQILKIEDDFQHLSDDKLEQLENVIVHLKDLSFLILHEEKKQEYKCMSRLGGFVFDQKGTLRTLYVMATLTLTGYKYIDDRKKSKRQDRLFWVPVAISFAVALTAGLDYYSTTIKIESLTTKLLTQDSLLKQTKSHLYDKEYQLHRLKVVLDSSLNVKSSSLHNPL